MKACGFFLFYCFFLSIAVSSLDVPLYASRSSADDFRSKSVRPVFYRYNGTRVKFFAIKYLQNENNNLHLNEALYRSERIKPKNVDKRACVMLK